MANYWSELPWLIGLSVIGYLLISMFSDFKRCNTEDSWEIWPVWDDPSGGGVPEWYERMRPV